MEELIWCFVLVCFLNVKHVCTGVAVWQAPTQVAVMIELTWPARPAQLSTTVKTVIKLW